MSERIFNVSRSTKTGKTVNVGDFPTVEQAQAAMLSHYKATPKRGDFRYRMLRSPIGIFQFEGEFAFQMLRQYEPHSIFDMSLVTAALRPSGASYRDDLMQHKPHRNPSSIIDELLADNNGYLIYQEDVIKFLQQICGFSGSDADNTRRAIGRKDEDRLKKALPQILEGYCEKSPQPREVAEQEAKEFLQIIQDASSYMFGYNHSVGYCMIGYCRIYFCQDRACLCSSIQ